MRFGNVLSTIDSIFNFLFLFFPKIKWEKVRQ